MIVRLADETQRDASQISSRGGGMHHELLTVASYVLEEITNFYTDHHVHVWTLYANQAMFKHALIRKQTNRLLVSAYLDKYVNHPTHKQISKFLVCACG